MSMLMKRIVAVAMSTAAVVAFAGCGGRSPEAGSDSTSSADTSMEDRTTRDDGDAVVVYFSATGHTEHIAELIAQETGADTFKIEPEQPYTEEDLDYGSDDSRVAHERNSREMVPLVSTEVPGWDAYDTVYFGYPIWWGDAAWPVDGFVSANDFSGKTVVPFCTSGSSGVGDSVDRLSRLAGTGDWLEGERFSGNETADEVSAWLDGLDL